MPNVQLECLRQLIGRRVRSGKDLFTIVDVLDEGPSVVLESEARERAIQVNQHGNPSRRGRNTLTLPVLSDDGKRWNPALQELMDDIGKTKCLKR
jgi:hypothetical protein